MKCYGAAVRFLTYRPRSESELKARLIRRKFDKDIIEKTIAKLKEQNLLDDRAFAEFWLENKDTFKPRSRKLLQQELRQKGVDRALAEQVTETVNDEESAYKAAQNKIKLFRECEYYQFLRKMGDFLRRRGFSYEVARHTCERIWRENKNGPQ